MIRAFLLTAGLVSGLSACARLADSRLNPLNWFGRAQVEEVQPDGERRALVPARGVVQVVDGRTLVDEVLSMRVERTPYGALVTATGLPETQGYFNAELIPASVEGGTLTLQFRAEAPAGFEAIGTRPSRALTAAYAIEAADLAGIRSIRVQGANNARVSAR